MTFSLYSKVLFFDPFAFNCQRLTLPGNKKTTTEKPAVVNLHESG
jgi:hypothetical protein